VRADLLDSVYGTGFSKQEIHGGQFKPALLPLQLLDPVFWRIPLT